jgi:hypothetical protein
MFKRSAKAVREARITPKGRIYFLMRACCLLSQSQVTSMQAASQRDVDYLVLQDSLGVL